MTVRVAIPIAIAAYSILVTSFAVLSFGAEFGLTGVVYASGWVTFALIGAFLGWKQPHNAVAWLFALIGVAALTGLLVEGENVPLLRALGAPDPVIAALAGLWFTSFALMPALLILFPNGRPASPRWRAVVWAIAITVPLGTLTSGENGADAAVGPAFVAAFGPITGAAIVADLQGLASVAMMTFIALGAISIGLRARRSRGVERQQLKWIAFGGALFAGTILLTFVAFFSPLRALDPDAQFPVMMFGGFPFVITLVSIPVSAAFAILRYRLYDIDVLINRALVYAALTAMLGLAYVGSVLALQALLRPFTAGSDVAVAVSTLGVVALFQPLRERIQIAVDRRFYRARYDAQRTLDAFADRMRDQVDLDDLRQELRSVLERTISPRHTSIWLRHDRR